ncbi:MAG: putative inner rane protein [Rhizobacter sp.]|nr:putative inner rane protein [Rhizobacter sp.]
MFGRSKPVVFDPYGRQRSRWPMPRWLVLLSIGVILGASGVLIAQERYLPPRLTADASIKLQDAYKQADAERLGLRRDLQATTQKLSAVTTDSKTLADRLATSSQTTERLQKDMGSMIDLLPPDPRGGTVSVRAARFAIRGNALDYEVLLTRGSPGTAPLAGTMQMSVAGGAAGGDLTKSVNARPVTVSIGAYESLRGTVELPAGFSAREATITVMDRPDGRVYGRRVMYVK